MAEETKSQFKPSEALESALADVLKHKPTKWGAGEHLPMLALLVLAASEQSEATPEQRKADGFKITIEWAKLKAELCQDSKLAECANFYKFLQSAKYMAKAEPREAKYLD